ncbi:MAG: AAA family ATPase, partial [Desulfobacteraceae bacterium]
MQWSAGQQTALDSVAQWLKKKNQPVFKLFGYAGTGKTTLARYLAQDVRKVLFGAYTGKAASVLREKGCVEASTIHQLMYLPAEKSRQKLRDLQETLNELLAETPVEDHPDCKAIVSLKQDIDKEKQRLKQPMFVWNPNSVIYDANLLIIDEVSMVDEKMGMDLLKYK